MPSFLTLLQKELMRFWKVSFQTIAAPILTALLYLLIFSHALASHVQVYPGVSYTAFLIPGLAMMSLLQNAFANSSSSIIQSKITGNLVFVLLSPLSPLEMFGAYALAAIVRGFVVGLGVLLVEKNRLGGMQGFGVVVGQNYAHGQFALESAWLHADYETLLEGLPG